MLKLIFDICKANARTPKKHKGKRGNLKSDLVLVSFLINENGGHFTNSVFLIVRLTRTLEIRVAGNDNNMTIARYTLVVDRKGKKDDNTADFISCVVFDKGTEFVQKYLHKGTKIAIVGRLRTGSY